MVNKETLELIREREGERLTAYLDAKDGWTIGVGHLSDTSFPVRKGMTITKEKSLELLQNDLKEAEDAVNRLITVPLNENQYGALVSFTFNLGEGNLEKSTLRRKLNDGDYASVPSELMKWVNDDGKKAKGLVIRRQMEGALFQKPVKAGSNTSVPSDNSVPSNPKVPEVPVKKSIWTIILEILVKLLGH